jgi:hypothetical protein
MYQLKTRHKTMVDKHIFLYYLLPIGETLQRKATKWQNGLMQKATQLQQTAQFIQSQKMEIVHTATFQNGMTTLSSGYATT